MTASLGFPLQFVRQFSAALDRDAVFATEAALNTYLTSGLRYAGQIASCVETGKAYMLNSAKDAWIELGADVEAGEKRVYGVSNAAEFDGAILALNELPGGGTIVLLNDIDDYALDTIRSIDNIKIMGALLPFPKITLTGTGALVGNHISLHKLQIMPFGENEPIIAHPGPNAYVETSNIFYPGGSVPMIDLAAPALVRSRTDMLIRYSNAANAIQFLVAEGSLIHVDGGTVINDGTCTVTGAASQNYISRNDRNSNESSVDGETTADALDWLKNQAPGTGDVSGASDVTDDSIALHDGTTGKLLKEGPVFGTDPHNAVQLDGAAKLPAVDGSNLTNLPSGAPLSDADPADLGEKTSGTATEASRADHVHQMPAIPAASDENPQNHDTASPGTSDDYSRADHAHASDAPAASDATPEAPTELGGAGTSDDYSRADHAHPEQVVTDGQEVELRITETHIQWRLGDGEWADLVALSELKGDPGDPGDPGTEVELQKTATHIQWRLVGGEWADLVALAELKGDQGDPGTEIELQKTETHIQWRLVGGEWADLVALTDLKGDQGDPGQGVPAGGTVGQVLEKIDSADYNTQWSTPSSGGDLPAGGAAKTMLRKTSATDYDAEWSPDVQYRIANSLFEDNGDLGEAKTFDYSNKTNHRGKMTEAMDITITGLSDGQRVGLHIYPGDTYSTVLSITSWTGVDKWLGGSAPTEGPEVDGLLGLTFLNDGVNTIGMAAQEEV